MESIIYFLSWNPRVSSGPLAYHSFATVVLEYPNVFSLWVVDVHYLSLIQSDAADDC